MVCRFCFCVCVCFCFLLLSSRHGTSWGETLEGPGAACPGRNLAGKVPLDTDSQHQSTTTTMKWVQAAGFNGHAPLVIGWQSMARVLH